MHYAIYFRGFGTYGKVTYQRRSRNVCIGFKGVYPIAIGNSRRKTYFAEYSQQSTSF